jgi:branched-chain amino acid transport system permease protein
VFAAVTAPLVVHARGVLMLMVTLAVGDFAVVAAGRFKAITGGTDGLAAIPVGPPVWGAPLLDTDRARYLYVLVVTCAVTAAVAAVLRTPAGLLLAATRDHEARMRASGHRVTRYVCAVYVAAGAIAGIGGSLLVSAQQYVSPADFGFDVAALLLLAVVLGGSTSVAGALAGTAVVFWTRDWLAGLVPGHAPLMLGTLFLVTVYLLPRGVAGLGGGNRRTTNASTGERSEA